MQVMDCNGDPMAIIKENLLHTFGHTPRAEYVVELPNGQEVTTCLGSRVWGGLEELTTCLGSRV